MKIVFVSSEVFPFAKTGGLADVGGTLPVEIANLGHDIIVFQPAYRSIDEAGCRIEDTDIRFETAVGNHLVAGRLLQSELPNSQVKIYFVDQPKYFDRDGLYQERGTDYQDNCERFVYFCRAVLDALLQLNWRPDVIHCNDWQTGLIPAYLKTIYRDAGLFDESASLITIHNLAYQGNFWHWDMLLTGLDWKYFNWHQMEFYGRLNFLKTGLVFADAISTVSPRYAQEIQTPEHGCGLQGVLSERRDRLTGILNGIDPELWNPQTDPQLPQNYGIDDWTVGKAACKEQLRRELGLNQSTGPLVGIVGRLASQKGWSLIMPVLSFWLKIQDVQWVVLGTGDVQIEQGLLALAKQHPDKLAVRNEFSDALARKIEAAADIFLMPSKYEPCGLNQQYSMRYGTVPVVHATGGLADTVTDVNPQTLRRGSATGFSFDQYAVDGLETALARAVDTYLNRPAEWKQLVETGMHQDMSWAASAAKYVQLYQHTHQRLAPPRQTV